MLRLQGEMIRGGTSKCWIFDHHHVAATGADTDALLLAAFNAADPRQIDGVGGASSTTSKAAIVRAVGGAGGVDVEYAFAQVGIGDERVEWTSNCGNCATAVALYAAHRGLVPVTGDTTTVRMRNVNTGARLTGTIPTPGGTVPEEGESHELLARKVEDLAERVEVLPDRLLLYTADGEETVAKVHERGLTPAATLVRRSTLEDVFLRLTGRTLVD